MDSSAGRTAYVFGDFRLDAAQRLLMLKADGRVIPLTAKAFDTLLYLVQHRDELLDKATLMSAIWPNLVVEENNLNQSISTLRRLLGDTRDEHRFIVTVPNRGYRFVAEVSVTDGTATPDAAKRPRARVLRAFGIAACGALTLAGGYFLWGHTFSTIPERTRTQNNAFVTGAVHTIAVLPFADMSPNKDQEYFADGLSEELSDQLSRLPGVRVIGPSSAFSFKDKNEDLRAIGKALGVRHILEGSVRKVGEQLYITARLVDSNGTRVWSETYDQKLGEVFAIQNEVAKSVAAALSITLIAGEIEVSRGGTRNIEAYDAYLAGKAAMISGRSPDVRRGIAQLERAVNLDPTFALAWSELALTYEGSNFIPERTGAEWSAKALEATARALEIAPDLPSVLAAAAWMSMQRKDWAEAERQFKKARELATGSENVWEKTGWFLSNVGRPREATQYFRRAALAEPLLCKFRAMEAATYEMSGDLDQAAVELSRCVPLPGDMTIARFNLLTQALSRRDPARIVEVLALWPPNDVFAREMRAHLGEPQVALAAVRHLADDPTFPKDNAVAQSFLAYWAAYFDDTELSLQYLGNMRTDASMAFVLWRPILKNTRRLPGFKDLVRDLGLVAYWRASGNWGEFCRPLGEDDFVCT